MTRKYIGRILVLSMVACSQATPSPNRDEVAVGKGDCYWSKTGVASDTRLRCMTTSLLLSIDTSGVPDSTKSGH